MIALPRMCKEKRDYVTEEIWAASVDWALNRGYSTVGYIPPRIEKRFMNRACKKWARGEREVKQS